jgi:uncharacterized protein
MTTAAPGDGGGPRPLPVRPRPVTGESTGSYVRRLARANHLRPAYLRQYLASSKDGTIRIDLLAAMAGRSPAALEHALADLSRQQGALPHRGPRARPDRNAARAALFTAIRRDAAEGRLSHRALADRYGVHRRTVLQALQSPVPAPRKPQPPRRSRLEPYKQLIRDMVQADPGTRSTVTSIVNTLVTEHGMTGISYSTVRNYVVSLRGNSRRPRPAARHTVASPLPPGPAPRTPAMTWSPAHLAVEQEDLRQLRDLLDAGHDVEDDDGHGWTLLRHAIDVEHDGHVRTGGPLHADITAFLLARGADPLHPCNGMTAVAEAEIRGHWLAAEIMRAWIARGRQPAGSEEDPQMTGTWDARLTPAQAACLSGEQ